MRKKKKTYASVMKHTVFAERTAGRKNCIAAAGHACGNAESAGCALGDCHVLYIWRHLSD